MAIEKTGKDLKTSPEEKLLKIQQSTARYKEYNIEDLLLYNLSKAGVAEDIIAGLSIDLKEEQIPDKGKVIISEKITIKNI